MAATGPESPRFVIVPHRPWWRRWGLWLALLWPASLLLAAWIASALAVPELARVSAALTHLQQRVQLEQAELKQLRQEVATLRRSDQISRSANLELQATLAEREEEVSGLRADIDFYERLVGATGQRRGLSVHDVQFSAENGGSWRYTVTLTQNLNRGAISRGEMRLGIEGVAGGRLQSLDWNELLHQPEAPAQPFSFRYFQQLEGSVLLPEGFTPQRVRVQLRADGATVDREFPWKAAGS